MDNYETILSRMRDKYKELTGCDVPELSDTDIRMMVLAGEIYQNEVNLDFVKRQISPETASGEYLDDHAYERGMERLNAVKAGGVVKFYADSPAQSDITIPKGSVVSTGGSEGIRFSTDYEVVLPGGAAQVSAPCTALTPGTAGNVAAGKVSLLVTKIVGIDSVSNLSAMKGGCNRETDEQLRKRIIESHKFIPNGTNAAFYKSLALSVDGVTSANVLPKARGEGTLDVYISAQRAVVDSTVVNKVMNLINSERELNVDVKVYSADPVSFDVGVEVELRDGYSLAAVTQNITDSINKMLDTMAIGESVYESHLGGAVISSEGVYNYNWLGGYRNRCTTEPEEFPVIGEIHIEAMGE